jgi:hypothetical protein
MGVMVLQNCMDLEKAVPVLWSETCPVSFYDANQAMSTKAEVVSDAEVEEDPVQITCPKIKAEPEVSCMSVCVSLLVFMSICLPNETRAL